MPLRPTTVLAALAFFLTATVAFAQPHFEFVGNGANRTAFDTDPANWAPAGGEKLGVPKETLPGSRDFLHSLRIFKQVELVIDAPRTRFSEALTVITGQLTVRNGSLSFQNLGVDRKNQGNLIQGRATVTVDSGASLILNAGLFLDKFQHTDPVPWIVLNGGKVTVGGGVTFLAGEVRIAQNGAFETTAVNFGARYNTGCFNFLPGSKGSLKITSLLFEKAPSTFEEMVRQGRVVIDGKRASWRRFKQTGDTLTLAK